MKTCVTCGAPFIPTKPAHGPTRQVCSLFCHRARNAERVRRHRARQRAARSSAR